MNEDYSHHGHHQAVRASTHGYVVYYVRATDSLKHNWLRCPIGTFPENCILSLLFDCVVLSTATEQLVSHALLLLPNLF